MQQFLRSIGRTISPSDEQFIVEGLQDSLGLQTISVGGVSASTHFAQVLVEADYRMKLIGIGLEEPPVNIRSYVSLANPAQVSRNALQRWYLCARLSADQGRRGRLRSGVRRAGREARRRG